MQLHRMLKFCEIYFNTCAHSNLHYIYVAESNQSQYSAGLIPLVQCREGCHTSCWACVPCPCAWTLSIVQSQKSWAHLEWGEETSMHNRQWTQVTSTLESLTLHHLVSFQAFSGSSFWSLAVYKNRGLQAIKNWSQGRPGNEASTVQWSPGVWWNSDL